MMPHTPLLICNNNINDTERVNKRLLETSVFLKMKILILINLIQIMMKEYIQEMFLKVTL